VSLLTREGRILRKSPRDLTAISELIDFWPKTANIIGFLFLSVSAPTCMLVCYLIFPNDRSQPP
jgi:hypothetical protein